LASNKYKLKVILLKLLTIYDKQDKTLHCISVIEGSGKILTNPVVKLLKDLERGRLTLRYIMARFNGENSDLISQRSAGRCRI